MHGAEVADCQGVGIVEGAIDKDRRPDQEEEAAEEHSRLQQKLVGTACQKMAHLLGPRHGKYWCVVDHGRECRGSGPGFRPRVPNCFVTWMPPQPWDDEVGGSSSLSDFLICS